MSCFLYFSISCISVTSLSDFPQDISKAAPDAGLRGEEQPLFPRLFSSSTHNNPPLAAPTKQPPCVNWYTCTTCTLITLFAQVFPLMFMFSYLFIHSISLELVFNLYLTFTFYIPHLHNLQLFALMGQFNFINNTSFTMMLVHLISF